MNMQSKKITLKFSDEDDRKLPLQMQVKYVNEEPFLIEWIKDDSPVLLEPPPPASGYKELKNDAIYIAHAIALRNDGTVVAWGRNEYGQCNVPHDLPPAVHVSVGFNHSTALLDDGRIRCWGQSEYRQCDMGVCANDRFVSIHSSHFWNAAMRADGTVHLWGAFNSNWFLPMHWEEKISDIGWTNLVRDYHSILDTRCIPLRMYQDERFKSTWTLLELSGLVKKEDPTMMSTRIKW